MSEILMGRDAYALTDLRWERAFSTEPPLSDRAGGRCTWSPSVAPKTVLEDGSGEVIRKTARMIITPITIASKHARIILAGAHIQPSYPGNYFPARGIPQSGQVWLRQGTPLVFGYSFLHFGHMHASGGIPRRCTPIPGPPFGIWFHHGTTDGRRI